MLIKIFILFSLTQAAVIKHEVASPKSQEFSFKDACQKLGAKNLELIESKSISEIDCMGKIYPAFELCLKEFPKEETLTRAIVDEKSKSVKCEMSESVSLSVSCDKRDAKYCLDAKKGCEELRKIYANKLEVAHSSLIERNLNCYFAKPLGDSL